MQDGRACDPRLQMHRGRFELACLNWAQGGLRQSARTMFVVAKVGVVDADAAGEAVLGTPSLPSSFFAEGVPCSPRFMFS